MSISQMILETDKHSTIERLLHEGADPNQCDPEGTPALVLAAALGDAEVVMMLVKAGVNVHAADSDGYTALHRAAAIADVRSMEVLLAARANIDSADKLGKTPMIIAATMGHIEACQVLAHAGADIRAADHQGRTALHWAALRNDDPDLVRFLLSAGANPGHRDRSGATPKDFAVVAGHLRALEGFAGAP